MTNFRNAPVYVVSVEGRVIVQAIPFDEAVDLANRYNAQGRKAFYETVDNLIERELGDMPSPSFEAWMLEGGLSRGELW